MPEVIAVGRVDAADIVLILKERQGRICSRPRAVCVLHERQRMWPANAPVVRVGAQAKINEPGNPLEMSVPVGMVQVVPAHLAPPFRDNRKTSKGLMYVKPLFATIYPGCASEGRARNMKEKTWKVPSKTRAWVSSLRCNLFWFVVGFIHRFLDDAGRHTLVGGPARTYLPWSSVEPQTLLPEATALIYRLLRVSYGPPQKPCRLSPRSGPHFIPEQRGLQQFNYIMSFHIFTYISSVVSGKDVSFVHPRQALSFTQR